MALLLYIRKHPWILYFLCLLTLGLAVYVNLGLRPFFSDDGLRGLVAFEMDKRGNYIVPTLFGDLYYNKPPLYNWFIILSAKLFGGYSNFAIRFANATAMIVFGLLIFRYLLPLLKHSYKAFFIAFASVSAVTILFEDSMVAEIDITFSLVAFGQMMAIFYWDDKNRWKQFLWSYFFAGLGFLMKGMPVVMFGGITLVVWFVAERKFWKLFCLQHLAGIALFVLMVGGYAAMYVQRSVGDPGEILLNLWRESTVRAVDNYGVKSYVVNFIRYPFQYLSSLLPWAVFVFVLFRKGVRKKIWSTPLLRFCFLTLVGNIWVYWISPGNNLRYNLMFNPFALIILVFLYFEFAPAGLWNEKLINWIYRVSVILFVLLALAMPFMLNTEWSAAQWVWWVVILVVGLMSAIVFFFWEERRFLPLLTLALLVKLGYNVFLLPAIVPEMKETVFMEKALAIAEQTEDEKLKIFTNCIINADMLLYIDRYRNEVVGREWKDFDTTSLYIIDQQQRQDFDSSNYQYAVEGDFLTRKLDRKLFVVRFGEAPPDPKESLKLR